MATRTLARRIAKLETRAEVPTEKQLISGLEDAVNYPVPRTGLVRSR